LAVAVCTGTCWSCQFTGHHLAGPITPDGPIKNQRGTSVSNSIAEAVFFLAIEVSPAEVVPESNKKNLKPSSDATDDEYLGQYRYL